MSFTVGQSALVGSLVAPLYTAVSPYTASFRIVELTDYRFGAVAGTFVPQSVYQIGVLPSLYYTFVPVGTIALEQGREYVLVLDPPEQTSAAPALVNWLRAEVDRNATVYFREGSAYGVSADPRAAFALLAAGGPEPGNVPEPGTLALIPAGLLLICWRSRLR